MAMSEHQRASTGVLDWGHIPVYALFNLGRDDHMKRSFVLAGGAIAALCLLLAPVQVQAQSFTASLQGTVKDSTGAVVQGARLALVHEATNVRQEKLLSDSYGLYLFTLLPPGTYKLTVEMPGFQ